MINLGIWVQYVPGHTSASNHKRGGMLAEHPDLQAADDVIRAREELAYRQQFQSNSALSDSQTDRERRWEGGRDGGAVEIHSESLVWSSDNKFFTYF